MALLELPMLVGPAVPHPEMVLFASEARPLRPSRMGRFLGCPMSVVLQMANGRPGGEAAQTGNIVHDAVDAFHKAKEDRKAAGLAALERARVTFPEGDPAKARKIFGRYVADPENENAVVRWVEEPVVLRLKAAPEDPTGEPVVIAGTLDQVRVMPDGRMRVWDVKTGEALTADESVLEYLVQQATYVLAARQTLDPNIEPGGLIYTPGYEKTRARRHIDLKLTVERCIILLSPVVHWVAQVRRGVPCFQPSPQACRFCDDGPWPKCVEKAKHVLNVRGV